MPYEQLEADKIIATVDTLHNRIVERFPNAGLAKVCGELLNIARLAGKRANEIARPIPTVRILSALVLVLILVSTGWICWLFYEGSDREGFLRSSELVQVVEAAMNALFGIGLTVLFFVTLETRIKRRRALRAIHELRCIGHIIDMHQLTKDPERTLHREQDTESSPRRTMTEFELGRYLDYCSEMLSVTGKIAALYVQNFEDPVAISAVNDIEDLTTGMSQKIWQKLSVLHETVGRNAEVPARTPPAPHTAPANTALSQPTGAAN